MKNYYFWKIILIFSSLFLLFVPLIKFSSILVVIPSAFDVSLGVRRFFLIICQTIIFVFIIKLLKLEILPPAHYISELNPKYSSRLGNILVICHSHHHSSPNLLQHELQIGSKFFCTGCYGTTTGLVCGLIVMFIYFLQLSQTNTLPIPMIWFFVSIIGIFLGLVKYLFPFTTPRTRIITNFVFGLGFPIFLIFIDNLWNSVCNDVLAVGILIVIVLSRLYLHRLEHQEARKQI
ncbi:MAG: hypothetical protein ACFFCZ_13120 [Promethearchaeota archaeon]